MTKRHWEGLVGIDVSSGTAMDGPEEFRGFCSVRATAEDGSFMAGQLDPAVMRAMALQFLEVAEAADQDAIVFKIMCRDMGVEPAQAAVFVAKMREERTYDDQD